MKLATELSKVATGSTLYILDEPTTGLHFADVQRLLDVLQRLVDQGNTVVVIEHNLDVIKSADRIVDLGPEGGEEGGELVAAGTPEQVAAVPESHTGRFLAELVEPAEAARDGSAPQGRGRGLTRGSRCTSSSSAGRGSSAATSRTRCWREGTSSPCSTAAPRGRDLFPDAEHVAGDRDSSFDPLAGRRFDAVVDTCAYFPRQVEAARGRPGRLDGALRARLEHLGAA